MTEVGVEPSVGSVGDSYDNALAETIIGLYKSELIEQRGPWRTMQAAEYATLEWVDWFNHRHLLEPIGNVQPAELEMHYLPQRSESAIPAWLKRGALRRSRGGSGGSFEDRQDLLGHRSGLITTHYSAAELANLIDAANSCAM